MHLNRRDKFRIETFNCIIDCLNTELCKRQQAYSELHEMFGFMTDSLSVDELRARARNLVVAYSSDLEESFVDEFVHCTFHVMTEADQSVLHVNQMLKADGSLLLATFSNVVIVLRL